MSRDALGEYSVYSRFRAQIFEPVNCRRSNVDFLHSNPSRFRNRSSQSFCCCRQSPPLPPCVLIERSPFKSPRFPRFLTRGRKGRKGTLNLDLWVTRSDSYSKEVAVPYGCTNYEITSGSTSHTEKILLLLRSTNFSSQGFVSNRCSWKVKYFI